MNKEDCYSAILHEEMVLAAGCTEPIAIAFAAAVAKQHLGVIPDRVVVNCSGNIIKNVKSVKIPNTNGSRGIEAAVIAGIVAGDPSKEMEVIKTVSDAQIIEILQMIEKKIVKINYKKEVPNLYVEVLAYSNESYVRTEIMHTHTNITMIEKDGEVLYENACDITDMNSVLIDRSVLNVKDIVEYGAYGNIDAVRELIEMEIKVNDAIAQEGLNHDWGSNVGKTLASVNKEVYYQCIAAAAAASDARMSGCKLPVMTNSGSGNQGITLSVPIITYAKVNNIEHEKLVRALVVANLINVHMKTGVGRLSAFCGAACAATAGFAGLAFINNEPLEIIQQVITNTIATDSGLICDGAKESCASKIATSLFSGLLGYEMAKKQQTFPYGCGIVQKEIDETIEAVGTVARVGMKVTDEVILNIMLKS